MNIVGDARTSKNSVAKIYGIDLNVFVFIFSGKVPSVNLDIEYLIYSSGYRESKKTNRESVQEQDRAAVMWSGSKVKSEK